MLIGLPGVVENQIVGVSLSLVIPSTGPVSPFTGRSHTVKLSGGHWEGTVTFGPAVDDVSASVEAFLHALGTSHWVRLPTEAKTETLDGIAVASTQRVDGRRRITAGDEMGDVRTLALGSYLTIADRLFHVVERSGDEAIIEPDTPVQIGARIMPGTHVLAARNPARTPLTNRTADWAGPWTMEWVEKLS